MAKEILITIFSGLLIFIGIIGSVLPILPGLPVAFGGFWLYAWYTDYSTLTLTVLVVFALLTASTILIDVFAPAMGAKGYKSSKYGVIGATLGAFLGIFIFGPLGIILGPLIGGFVGEYAYSKNHDIAIKTAWGSFIGLLIGSLYKVVVGAAMLAYFVYALFK